MSKQSALINKALDKLVKEEFLYFLLEKWKISSGEHKAEPFAFKDAPYLYEIITDEFPFQVTLKSAQCRISEVKVARTIHRAISKKGNQLYTFPAGEQMEQFVDARIRSAIIDNEYLSKFVTGSLNLKKFSLNNNQIYFRGVQKRRQIISVDVSVLRADECDEYEEGILYTLNKRLGAAKEPIRDYFSTPSYHGVGVSLYYYGSESQNERGSDQRVWTIRCEHCGKWNEDLLWPENVIDLNEKESKSTFYKPDVIVICRFCKKGINRLTSDAIWVAKVTANSDFCHGRHVSKLFSPTANLNQMMLDSKDPLKEQEFYNSDLGLPYEPKGSRLTDEILGRCRGSHQLLIKSNDTWNVLGGDIGNKIHVTISTKDENSRIKIIALQELDDWTDLPYLMHDFNIKTAVIDANPDKEEAIDFQKQFDGQVWLAYYLQHLEKTKDKISINWEDNVVYIHRTLMMMVLSDMYIEKEVILPIDYNKVRDFAEHMKSPIKALKQDTKGDWIAYYPKTRIPDHYYHSGLYNLVGHLVAPKKSFFRLVNLRP